MYIVTVIEHFSTFAEAFALSNHTAIRISDTLVSRWISRYGVADQIHTDQAPDFQFHLFHNHRYT